MSVVAGSAHSAPKAANNSLRGFGIRVHFNSKILRVKWMNLHVKCAIKVADWKVVMLYLPAYGIFRLEFLNVSELPDRSTALAAKRSVYFKWLSRWLTTKVIIRHSSKNTDSVCLLRHWGNLSSSPPKTRQRGETTVNITGLRLLSCTRVGQVGWPEHLLQKFPEGLLGRQF